MPSTLLSRITLGPGFLRIAPHVLPPCLYTLQSCFHCPILLKQMSLSSPVAAGLGNQVTSSSRMSLQHWVVFHPRRGPSSLGFLYQTPLDPPHLQSLGFALHPAPNLLPPQLLGHQTAPHTPTATRAPTSDSLFCVSHCLLDISFWMS